MITTAQDFWNKTPLKAVGKLMDQTFSYAQDADDKDMAEMYMDDHRDVLKAIRLFRLHDGEGLAEFCDRMDTAPREQLILAFAEDCGKDFVEAYLGYEVC